jgi:single-strand DNA-binding protein
MIGHSSVTLLGTLATDPKVHTTSLGTVVATFTVLVIRRRPHPGRPGRFLEQWTHVPVTAFNKHAEAIGEYLKHGGRIFIDGHLEERRDRTQPPASSGCLDIIVDQFQFLDDLPPDPAIRDKPPAAEGTRPH